MPGFSFPAAGRLGLTSPPYRPDCTTAGHRYYDPLRLPNAYLGFVRSSLSAPDTLCRPSLSFVSPLKAESLLGGTLHTNAGISLMLDLLLPSIYTRTHLDLPSFQATPVTACPGLRPRWCPDCLPFRNPDCCLPLCSERRLSFWSPKNYPMATMCKISGLNTQPAALIYPASDSCYQVCPRTSLLICWLNFNQVGLSRLNAGSTHWVTLSNFIPLTRKSQRPEFVLAREHFLPSNTVVRFKGIISDYIL